MIISTEQNKVSDISIINSTVPQVENTPSYAVNENYNVNGSERNIKKID